MLPKRHRIRTGAEFALATHKGFRRANQNLVVYLIIENEIDADLQITKVGFVVPKTVGNAVQRNIVKRRLRAAVKELWEKLNFPNQTFLVIRANSAAKKATYAELCKDVETLYFQAKKRILK